MYSTALLLVTVVLAAGAGVPPHGRTALVDPVPLTAPAACYDRVEAAAGIDPSIARQPLFDPRLLDRLAEYARLSAKHRLAGLASYYSGFFDGRKTANGEIFRNGRYSAAHLTLPLGTWIEVKARATGRTLRLRVNDRGPYVKKFALDLSQAAARYLGVDRTRDRYVEFRIIALPGEEPPPEDVDWAALDAYLSRGASATMGR